MTSNSKYFDGDCVYRITRKGRVQFGVILENAEYLSSDDEDEVYETQLTRMKRGRIRVAWHPKGQSEILSEKAVNLHDRFLTPGEVVRRVVGGEDTQLGYCRSTKISATLHVLGTNYVIDNVDSAGLRMLEGFRKDAAICVGGTWTGLIQSIKRELGLRFPDRSMCVLQESDAAGLEDVVHRRQRTSELPNGRFYVGQLLHGPMKIFKSARWLYHSSEVMAYPPDKHVQVVVEKVKPVEAYARSLSPHGESNVVIHFPLLMSDPPPRPHWPPGEARQHGEPQPWSEAASGEEVANVYLKTDMAKKGVQALEELETWARPVGSRRLYELQVADMIELEVWRQTCAQIYGNPAAASGSVPAKRSNGGSCNYDQPVGPSDLDLMSGAAAKGAEVPSQPLLKCGCPLPEELTLKPGDVVVTETLATTTRVDVVWQDGTVESNILSTDLYPVLHLDENEFFPGDIVTENTDSPPVEEYGVIQRIDHRGRTAEVAKYRMYKADAENPQPEELGVEEVSVYNIREHLEFNYKPTYFVFKADSPDVEGAVIPVGQVVDIMPPGHITVHWLDGTRSQCHPQELVSCLRSHYHPEDDLDTEDDYMDVDEGEDVLVGPLVEMVGSHAQQLFERMQAQVEVLCVSLARLEESVRQHPVMQSNAATRRLGELYRQSNQLLHLVGASCLQWGWANLPRELLMQIRRLFSPATPPPQPARDGASGEQERASPPTSSPQRLMQMSLSQLLNLIVLQSRNFQNQVSSMLSRAYSRSQSRTSTGTLTEEDFPHEEAAAAGGKPEEKVEGEKDVAGGTPAVRVPPEFGATFVPSLRSALEAPLLPPPEATTERDEKEEKADGDKRQPISFLDVVGQRLAELMEAEQDEQEEAKKSSEVPAGTGDNEVDDIVVFSLMKMAPETHSYKHLVVPPNNLKTFATAVRKEMTLLARNLPDSIVVKSFEDRSDLYSALIRGPHGTPYEDGLFLFDLRLPPDYPQSPPLCHYHSFCRERLNPNLYVDGKVCVSLLGTWDGKGSEVWSPKKSNLLQLFVSIQGLILVAEPYYNEAGFEQQRGCPKASENSRVYNERVILKVLQSMQVILATPQVIFKEEIKQHFVRNAARYVARLESWIRLSDAWHRRSSGPSSASGGTLDELAQQGGYGALPDFPLLPVSRGFCLAVGKELATFKDMLKERGINFPAAADEGGQS